MKATALLAVCAAMLIGGCAKLETVIDRASHIGWKPWAAGAMLAVLLVVAACAAERYRVTLWRRRLARERRERNGAIQPTRPFPPPPARRSPDLG